MFGPGTYRRDPSEGITAIADLPPPELVPSSRTYMRQACPRCGYQAYRDKQYQRTLHDLGNLDVWCPRDLLVTYSQHYCTKCRKYFSADLSDLAPPGSQYTHRNTAALQDPNRVVPLDALRELERQGIIGQLLDEMFVTVGNIGSLHAMKRIGAEIAGRLVQRGVQAVVLPAT